LYHVDENEGIESVTFSDVDYALGIDRARVQANESSYDYV
jgi:hypothetical protein